MQWYVTKKCFVALSNLFGADSLSETERCIAARQNQMTAPNIVSAHFKKINVFLLLVFFLDEVHYA